MKAIAAMLAVAALTSGCRKWEPYEGAFDQPHALGVLQPENGGPFAEPIGFVGNQHGGQIGLLALKQGRFLADDPSVAYLRGNPLATGQQRILAGVAPIARDDGTIEVYAADRHFDTVVRVPYSTGIDDFGAPIEVQATVSTPEFSGPGSAQMLELEVKTGWVSTEDWVVEFVGDGWVVTGSVSGRQQEKAQTGEPFRGVRRVVAFTIEGDPSTGARFEFSTDNGLVELDPGGKPLALRAAPSDEVMALIVEDDATWVVSFLDPTTDAFQTVALPAGAQPSRLAWSADSSRLFVTDVASARVHEIAWPSGTLIEHRLPWPVSDVANLDGEFGDLLYLSPIESNSVWIWDIGSESFRDVNPWLEGIQGQTFAGPVSGLEAMPLPYLQLARDDDGVRYFRRSVAVSLASGLLVFAEEGSGCLVQDALGARTDVIGQFGSSLVDYQTNYDSSVEQPPLLARNIHNTRHVLTNPCGGVTRSQTWQLTYDELEQGWQVEGTVSGKQSAYAREDRRYISDDGEISFLMQAGGTISEDGWTANFSVVEGLTVADGDTDGDSTNREIVIDAPGDPIYFHYTVGRDDQGWRPVDDRPFVLIAGESSDRVGRVMPQEGVIDAAWE